MVRQLRRDLWSSLQAFTTRHQRAVALFTIGWPALFVAFCIIDRDPPVRTHEMLGQIPQARAGEEIRFEYIVDRDVDRNCSVRTQRYIIDSSLTQRAFGVESTLTWAGLRKREELTPDRTNLTFTLPLTLAPGHARLVSESRYTCLRNPSTLILPIDVVQDWPFVVLPTEKKP